MHFVIKHGEDFVVTEELPVNGEVEILGKISNDTLASIEEELKDVAEYCPDVHLGLVKPSPVSGTVLLHYMERNSKRLVTTFRCKSHMVWAY